MSTESRWTPAQERGVTKTSPSTVDSGPAPGEWSGDVRTYGEGSFILPGTGSPGDDCGEYWPREFCDAAGHVNLGMHQCGNRECPRCSTRWTREQSAAITRRFAAARHAAEEAPDKRLAHCVASPPEGKGKPGEQFYRMLSDAYDLAKEKGIRGGVVIPHGYRATEDAKQEFAQAKDDGFDGGIWRWMKEAAPESWRDYVKWSPHFHILGLADAEQGGHIEPGDDDGDGWVWQNIRSLERFKLRDEEGYDDMVGAARYLLSHVTFEREEGRQAYRWFGDLAPAAFSPEEEVSAGALSVIERMVENVAGASAEREDGGAGDDEEEREECPRDGCDGHLHPIWDARDFLDQRGDELGEEAYDRLMTAHLWATGDIDPPPGMKKPRTEEQAEEALDALCSGP